MSQEIRRLLSDLKDRFKKIYGERLRGLYLFGSYARGEEDEESDLDIAVVLDDFSDYGAEINRTGAVAASLSLQYGVSISKVFFREGEWMNSYTPFLINVKEEAILA